VLTAAAAFQEPLALFQSYWIDQAYCQYQHQVHEMLLSVELLLQLPPMAEEVVEAEQA
jgi:hypothetical protein